MKLEAKGEVKGSLAMRHGIDGYTPQKSIDYWTPSDVAEIDQALQEVRIATENANEVTQAVVDEKYILTAKTTFSKDASVSPTYKGNAIVDHLGGDIHQQTYNGFQLFDASKLSSITKGGATLTNNGDGSFTITGGGVLTEGVYHTYKYSPEEALKLIRKAGNYRMKTEIVTCPYLIFGVYNESTGGLIAGVHNGSNTTSGAEITEDCIESIRSGAYALRLYAYGISGRNIVGGTVKPMVYINGDGTWEPFVGGQPSPSPSYPQRIEGVGDKGWFDGELLQGSYSTTNGNYNAGTTTYICNKNPIPCKEGDVVKWKYEKALTYVMIVHYGDNGFIGARTFSNVSEGEFTFPSGAKYFNFNINDSNGVSPSTAKHITVTINGKYAWVGKRIGKNLTTAYEVYKEANAYSEMVVDGRKCVRMTSGRVVKKAPIKFKENTQYTVSFYSKPEPFESVPSGNIVFTFWYTDGTSSTLRSSNTDLSWKLRTLTSVEGKTVESIGVTAHQYQIYDYIDVDTFMLEEGATMTEYQPYSEQKVYIPLDSPMYDGDYIEYDGKYKCVRENAEYVFNGTEAWREMAHTYGTLYIYSHSGVARIPAHSTHFKGGLVSDLTATTKNALLIGSDINVITDGVQTLADFKSFLAEQYANGTPVKMVYKKSTPTVEELDQTPFYELTACDGATNIEVVGLSDNLHPTNTIRFPRSEDGAMVTSTYVRTIKNEQRLAKLEGI